MNKHKIFSEVVNLPLNEKKRINKIKHNLLWNFYVFIIEISLEINLKELMNNGNNK